MSSGRTRSFCSSPSLQEYSPSSSCLRCSSQPLLFHSSIQGEPNGDFPSLPSFLLPTLASHSSRRSSTSVSSTPQSGALRKATQHSGKACGLRSQRFTSSSPGVCLRPLSACCSACWKTWHSAAGEGMHSCASLLEGSAWHGELSLSLSCHPWCTTTLAPL